MMTTLLAAVLLSTNALAGDTKCDPEEAAALVEIAAEQLDEAREAHKTAYHTYFVETDWDALLATAPADERDALAVREVEDRAMLRTLRGDIRSARAALGAAKKEVRRCTAAS